MYQGDKTYQGLLPLSWLYGIGVRFRNMLFDKDILHSHSYPIPIICIGNLSVGGTGKTPHTEYLIRLLRQAYQVAVLSRGYRRQTKGYILATAESKASDIGDEPCQMKHKYLDIRVAVDEKRCEGIEQLLQIKPHPVEAILLDDAFQHRYVKAGLNILLTDYNRLYSKDKLLPAGLLREPQKGKERAQIIIVTKCPATLNPIDYCVIRKQLDIFPYQQLFYTKIEYGDLYKLFDEEKDGSNADKDASTQQLQLFDKGNRPRVIPLRFLKHDTYVLALTGIANNEQMIGKLRSYVDTKHLVTYDLSDHYGYTLQDIQKISHIFQNELPSENRIIVTTEKDAAKLRLLTDIDKCLKDCLYVLPIQVAFLQNKEKEFNQIILDYVRKNKRNSIVPER